MKRTLALIGLLVVGLLLLLDPDTGIVTATAEQVTQTSVVVASPTATTGAPPAPDTSSTTTTTEAPPSSTTSSSTTATTTVDAPTTTEGTFTVVGESFDSPFGSFQVEIVVEDGLLVDVVTLEEPPDRRSQRINDQVIPIYEEDAISTQSSDFDVISGATVTWEAWGASLESALFEAGV